MELSVVMGIPKERGQMLGNVMCKAVIQVCRHFVAKENNCGREISKRSKEKEHNCVREITLERNNDG
jgi:hypothetical protein